MKMSTNKSIGVIGLGQIGGGIAATLARNGYPVWGYDISPGARAEAKENGVHVASGLDEVTATCDIIATSLSNLAAIEEIYFGTGGLALSKNPNLLTIECSTVAPDFAQRITRAMYESGKTAIEASVIGLGQDARAGNLVFIVAGEPQAVAQAGDFLNHAGKGQIYIGPSGTAAIVKLLNNAIGAVTLCAIAEAMAIVRDLGIDPCLLVEVIQEGRGDGYSTIFQRHASHMADWRQSSRAFSPIPLKDAKGVAKLIGDRGAAVPHLAAMASLYQSALVNAKRPAAETLAQLAEDRLRAIVGSSGGS
jgi:3-hydroxyisobutyrate dehydrogenase-like beta-hydroxyacid dehydrogenase